MAEAHRRSTRAEMLAAPARLDAKDFRDGKRAARMVPADRLAPSRERAAHSSRAPPFCPDSQPECRIYLFQPATCGWACREAFFRQRHQLRPQAEHTVIRLRALFKQAARA